MKKTTVDREAVRANMSKLKTLKKFGSDLLEYWPRLIKNVSPSTEDYRKWAGNPAYIYERYRELQLEAGLTELVFDNLPAQAQQPELDDPRPQHNPLQVTRQGEGGTVHGAPQRSKFQPGRYPKVARLAGMVKNFRDEHEIIVNTDWLELRKGKLEIIKDAEKRLTHHFTTTFTDKQMEAAEATEAILAGFQKVYELTGGKIPISTKGGKVTVDEQAIKRL